MTAGSRPTFLRSVELSELAPRDSYPFDLPAMAGLDDVEFGPVTIFVGENGSGKSTFIEAIATKAGLNAEGGSTNLQFETYATHSNLGEHLSLRWARRPSWGWFLRAETPLLMRMPGATIYELGPDGVNECAYDDLTVVNLWRRFLAAPERLLETLFADDD